MRELNIKSVEVKSFKNFDSVVVDDLKRENYIVGRNAEGKSALLNAIVWSITGQDLWGNKVDIIKEGYDASWVLLDANLDLSPMPIRRMINRDKKGKSSTTANIDLEYDKLLFYSMANPRYVQTLGPSDVKKLISLVVNEPMKKVLSSLTPELLKEFDELLDVQTSSTIAKLEEKSKLLKDEAKKKKEEYLMEVGKVESITSTIAFAAENGVIISGEMDDLFSIKVAGYKKMMDILLAEEQSLKEEEKRLSELKDEIYKFLGDTINLKLRKNKIKLFDGKKEVFIMTYNGKEIKQCSNSEQLLSGLELVDVLSELSDLRYPCVVDNAECILDVDLDEYPNIEQFFFALVADEELSTWESGIIKNLETKTFEKRSLVDIRPKVRILEGWGKK